MRILYTFILLFVASCAMSNNAYDEKMQKWVGQPEYELYERWGTPDDVFYISDNKKIITFTRLYQGHHKNAYTNEVNYQAINSGYQSNNNAYPDYCRTSFTVINGIISDYTFSGDYCVTNKW